MDQSQQNQDLQVEQNWNCMKVMQGVLGDIPDNLVSILYKRIFLNEFYGVKGIRNKRLQIDNLN